MAFSTMNYYYSAIRKNKMTELEGKQLNLDQIILNEVTETQKDSSQVLSVKLWMLAWNFQI